MATLLTPQPKPITLFDVLLRAAVVLIPAFSSSYMTYKQGQSESSAGYKALVQSVVQLQTEVKELHEKEALLQSRNERLEVQQARTDQLLFPLVNALHVPAHDQKPLNITAAPLPAPMEEPHAYVPQAPPATLQEAVKAE